MENFYLPYLFLILILVLFFVFQEFRQVNKRSLEILALIVVILFFGLRGFVYSDWYQYYLYFKNSTTLWEVSLASIFQQGVNTSFIEYGFRIYTVLVKTIYPDFFFWQFVTTFIDFILLHIFLKTYSKNYILSLILFVFFGGFVLGFNLMRNFLSILIFLNSIKYITQRKIVPFFLLNILGLGFHFTSIIYFPLYFVINRKISPSFMWVSFIVGNVIYLMQFKYLGPTIIEISHLFHGKFEYVASQYINSQNYGSSYGITVGYLERIITFAIVVTNFNSIVNSNKVAGRLFLNSFFVYFMLFSLFSEANIFTDRFTILFVFSYWILIPELYSLLKVRSNKIIWMFVLMCFGITKTAISNNNILNSYRNILFSTESYKSRSKLLERNKKIIFKK